MSDESPHPDHELASQYVDGLLSAPERARVEATPETVALVRLFEAQRTALADVPMASSAVRESAVAAALAAAHAPVAALVAPPPNVVSIDRRRRTRTWLTAAAAVVVLGVGGAGVVALLGNTGSDDSASSAVETLSGDSQKGDAATVAGGSPEVRETGGGADTTSAGVTDVGITTEASISSILGPSSAVPEVRTSDDLRALPEPSAAVSPSFVFDCPLTPDQSIIAEISWQGTPAVAVRDTVTGVITALDAQCTVLATVEP